MFLFLLLILLVASSICDNECDKEYFTRTKFDDIKTDPFQKVIVMAQKDKVEQICKLLEGHSAIINRALGVITYLIDPEEESEENLDTLHYKKGESMIYVQSTDGVALKFNGELDGDDIDYEVLQNNLNDFIEIRLTMPGHNLLLSWPIDGLEGVIDGGMNEIPALIGLSKTEKQDNFIERIATRNKGELRVYHINCNEINSGDEREELCKYGPGLLFIDHYTKYTTDIYAYRKLLNDTFDELETSRWIDNEKSGKHTNDYIKFPSGDNKQGHSNIKSCIPHCGLKDKPLMVSPRSLREMMEWLRKKVEALAQ